MVSRHDNYTFIIQAGLLFGLLQIEFVFNTQRLIWICIVLIIVLKRRFIKNNVVTATQPNLYIHGYN